MKLLVIGAKGSIGKRRLGLLEQTSHDVRGIDVETVVTPRLLKGFDAAFICTPPNTHAALGTACSDAGVPFFLEKPGATGLRDFMPLAVSVEKSKVINMIACNLRFTNEYKYIQDSLANLGKLLYANAEFGYFLPFWRTGEYRTYYSAYKAAGGGIMMDAIHEFDYIFSLFGHPKLGKDFVSAHIQHTKELDMEVEDSINVMIGYQHGPDMIVHLDYLQRAYRRSFRAVGTKGALDVTFNVQGSDQMYRAEMKHFLDCVRKGEETINPVWKHQATLDFIDALKDKAENKGDA